MIKYSIVIIAKNEEKEIGKTVESILKYKNSKVEVIVIDDDSTDNTAQEVSRFKGVRLISNSETVGISESRNIGILNALGDYIILLDAHVLLDADIFSFYDYFFEKYPKISGVSGIYKILNSYKEDKDVLREQVRKHYRFKESKEFIISYGEFTTLSSCILCVSKAVFQKFLFSKEYKGVAAEDTFLQMLLMKEGYKFLHSSKVSIKHNANINFKNLFFKKVPTQCKGTYKLTADCLKNKIKLPYSTFYLDFPLITFLSVLLSLILLALKVKIYWILIIILSGLIFDFVFLYKVVFDKGSNLCLKLETILYIVVNELVKIYYLPLCVVKYRINIFKLFKLFFIWKKEQFKRLC